MIHRLLSFPLTSDRFKTELDYIIKVANINGYSKASIMNLIRKKKRRMKLDGMSTLFKTNRALEKQRNKTIFLTYHPTLTKLITKSLKSININVILKPYLKISELLGSTKDKLPPERKSGIYLVQCKDCEMAYIGQTCKSLTHRFKQHLSKFINGRFSESAVALHMHEAGHHIDDTCLELLEHVSDKRRLNCTESYFIQFFSDTDALLNRDNGPLETPLLRLAALPQQQQMPLFNSSPSTS